MLKNNTLLLILITLFLVSCQFNQSVERDLLTGEQSRGDGLGCDDVVIEINGKPDNRNEFEFGEDVNFIFNNMKGLTKVDNKTYPGLSIFIVKNEKDTMFSVLNALQDLENGTDLSPLRLNAYFRAALGHQSNEKYIAHVNIWDNKGEGKFYYKLPFTVKENKFLKIKSRGLDYTNIYMWNETLGRVVSDKKVSFDHKVMVILNGVDGLVVKNEMVFPVFSLDVIDDLGNKILSNPNLLSEYEIDGISPDVLRSQVFATITLTKGRVNNPCKLIATMKDRNSSKVIKMETELILE